MEELMAGFHQRHTPTKLVKPFVRMLTERSVRFAAPGILETRTIRLRKGLSQGFPASPFLFTMVLETVVAPLV